MRYPHKSRGFTLLEVLVAIGIAAIGLSAVLSVITNTAGNAGSQRDRTLASWVGLNQLTQTRLAGVLPEATTTKGDVDFANARYSWTQTVTQTDVPGIRRIDIKVRLSGDSAEINRAFVTGFMGRAQSTSPLVETQWDQQPTASGPEGSQGQASGTTGAKGTTPTPGTNPGSNAAAGAGLGSGSAANPSISP